MRMNGYRMIYGGVRSIVGGFVAISRQLPEDFLFWSMGRDWEIPLGPIEGKKGERKTIEISVNSPFRTTHLFATDSSEHAGYGTRIQQALVGDCLQFPVTSGGTLTFFFSNQACNQVRWDTIRPWQKASMTIEFIEDCTFTASVWGKTLLW